LLTAAFFYVFRARRKQSQQHTAFGGGMSSDFAIGSKPELDANRRAVLSRTHGALYSKPELESTQLYEMDHVAGARRPAEFYAS
jgi:hypothetical protein